MSAYGTLSPTARPPRVLPTPWALPTPAFATWQGVQGKPPAPLPQALGRLQPVKAKPQAVASQALTGFQLHPLRIVLLLSRRWRGVKGGEAVHFTLDALEPTQHFATGSGGWVLTACPCGAKSEAGVWGKAPKVLTQERPQCTVNACVYRKYRGSDMKLGVSQHFDKSDHLPMMTPV